VRGSFLFVHEESQAFIWARIFLDPLSHAALDQIREELQETRSILTSLSKEGWSPRFFIFFPSMTKGLVESLGAFSEAWHFFEYCFMENKEGESLAFREYQGKTSTEPEIDQKDKIEHPPSFQESHGMHRARLTRKELSALIELSIDLKKS